MSKHLTQRDNYFIFHKVAHTGVRHNGTIAGNLMLKHQNNWFPSDVFCLLEGSGAQIVVRSAQPEAFNPKQQDQT